MQLMGCARSVVVLTCSLFVLEGQTCAQGAKPAAAAAGAAAPAAAPAAVAPAAAAPAAAAPAAAAPAAAAPAAAAPAAAAPAAAAPAAAAPAAAAPAAAAPAAAAPAANDPDDGPSLDQWIEDAKNKTGAFPRMIAFVTELPAKGKGEAKFLQLDADAFAKLGYFRVPNLKSVEWDYKLNRNAFKSMDPFDVVLQLTRADTVVLAPAKGDWQFLRTTDGKRTTVLKAKGPKSKKPQDVANWMLVTLGWDGVVIDQRGDYLLVGSTTRFLKTPEIQALAVDASNDKFSLTQAERKGAGLLSLSQVKGGIGIFDIVFLGQGVKGIPPGTKLIIEKKK